MIAHMNKHRFHLILPTDLWQRIQTLALRNRRPVTQEIIIAIEDHLDADEANTQPPTAERKQSDERQS